MSDRTPQQKAGRQSATNRRRRADERRELERRRADQLAAGRHPGHHASCECPDCGPVENVTGRCPEHRLTFCTPCGWVNPAAAKALLQAMWDALGILGFDQDGDRTPDARLTQGLEPFIESFLADIRQARADHDEAIDEVPLPHERAEQAKAERIAAFADAANLVHKEARYQTERAMARVLTDDGSKHQYAADRMREIQAVLSQWATGGAS